MEAKRDPSYDYLRVIATFGVIVIHVCAMEWRKLDVFSYEWTVINGIDAAVKFSVPIFFMISGRFMLDSSKNNSIQKIISKCKSLLIAFLFWTSIYFLLNMFRVLRSGDSLVANYKWITIEFFTGEYHMWFIYAILGLYLVTPLVQLIVADKKSTQYFLILFFAFGVILPVVEMLPSVGILVKNIDEEITFTFATGYVGYYVLGYYLYKWPLTKKVSRYIYIGAIISLIYSVLITTFVSRNKNQADEDFVSYLSFNVAIISIAIYTFINHFYATKNENICILRISKSSFGIYLIHPLILWLFEWIGLVPSAFQVILSIPIISMLAFLISITIVSILQRNKILSRFV